MTVDPERTVFNIDSTVVSQTAALIGEAGWRGYEGSAVWIGTVTDDGATATIRRVYRPEQVAYATPSGLSVEVTEAGLSEMIGSLKPAEMVLARLHTHGNDDVNHSRVDDANLLVGHPGAVSVVVPRFAANGIVLDRCGVHVLGVDHRWRRLSPERIRERFHLT